MEMVEYDDLTEEQRTAVDALDRSVVLTAGAGTGKTTTLTARYLQMLERSIETALEDGRGEEPDTVDHETILSPDQILTTTFTERAANELEASIRTEITERLDDLDPEAFAAWRRVADDLGDGYIHTLHGFCARLLREHALAVEGVDPGFEPIDDDEAAFLIRETVETLLEEREGHPAVRTLAWRFDRRQLEAVVSDLLGERPESVQWAERWADASVEEYLEFVRTTLHPIDRQDAAELFADPAVVEAIETLRSIVEQPPEIDTGGNAWELAVEIVETVPEEFADGVPSETKQDALAELGVAMTNSSGDRYSERYYTSATTNWGDHPRRKAFDDALRQLMTTIEPEELAVEVDFDVEAASFPFVRALAELTLLAADAYEERKRRRNALDFTDLILKTVEFLEDDANESVRRQLRTQFEYVMVDEFQDTDPRQWDLIKLLTASRKDSFDADNVFVVGDVKQSIYRFRNADVTQFKETAETIEARAAVDGSTADQEELSTNFRTLPTVLGTINELFDAIFVEDGADYEATPQRLDPYRDDPAGVGSVEYLAVPTDPDLRSERFDQYEAFAEAEPDDDTELEAMALAARLSQLFAERLQVYPEHDEAIPSGAGDGYTRAIEPSDVAILLRSRTKLKAYERALEDASIPYSVASGLGFWETPEITALVNLFRVLADPEDDRALYGVLRSPLFGVTDDTLARLAHGSESLWTALQRTDEPPLSDAGELLKTWRRQAGLDRPPATDTTTDAATGTFGTIDGSWAAFLTTIVDATGFLASVSAGERSRQAMANVEKFRQQLRQWEEDGVRSLPTLVARLEDRIEIGGREGEAETDTEGVQILTIHDAKGMEFPVVVVPGVDRGFNLKAALGDGAVEFEQLGSTPAVGMKAPDPDDPFERADTVARQSLRERRRDEELAEEKRVLYVACTRARDHLLLSGLHDAAGEADAPTCTAFEAADPESPSSWRDWVQPELLSEPVLSALDENDSVDRSYGDGSYRVSLPTPPVSWGPSDPEIEPAVTLSPRPPTPRIRFRLSATDLAALLGGYGSLRLDPETRLATVERTAATPDDRHGEADAGEEVGEATDRTDTEREATTGLPPRVFGEIVHRLCELRPPEDAWQSVIEQTLADEGVTVTDEGMKLSDDGRTVALDDDLKNRIRTHTERGIEYVDGIVADHAVEQQYDELYLRATFDQGEIVGYVDHLVVTLDAYHVVDYKTGDVEPSAIESDASYYEPQLRAYAIALHQQDPTRDVHASLVFTAVDRDWETTWTAADLETETRAIEAELARRLDRRR